MSEPYRGIVVKGKLLSPDAKFIPWPLPKLSTHVKGEGGVLPISEWGAECGRGFVSDSRFSATDRVIKRTNRQSTRKWRAVGK